MKKLSTILLGIFMACYAMAQTARVQIIHNSPTPTVDIYAGTSKLLDNFAFRTATPYIDVPANTPINIGVALANSTSSSDAIATFPVTFQANRTYVVVAAGVVGGAQPFNLFAYDMGAETSNAPGNVGIAFFHGSPDAPEVDITTGGSVLYDNVSFGEFSGYLNVPAASYQLDVTPGNDNSTIVASYNADFSFWKGRTAVVFASGFLGGGQPGFEPWVALDNGGTFPLKAVTGGGGNGGGGNNSTARVQIIHNSPTPTVDLWVNGSKFLDDFAFRTATPYVDVPAGVNLDLGIALGNSMMASEALVSYNLNLTAGKKYVVVANGIVGGNPGFDLEIFDMGQEMADAPGNVGILFFHGSPDAPEVDITTGGSVLYDNVSFGEFSGYLNVPAASYQLDITPGNNNSTIVASYDADLSFWKGRTAVVFASGFLGGGSPGFEPWVALDNGGTFPLRPSTSFNGSGSSNRLTVATASAKAQVYPNPASSLLNVSIETTDEAEVLLSVVNVNGQLVMVKDMGIQSAGKQTAQLDLTGLQTGTYFLRTQVGKEVNTTRFQVIR